MFYLCKCQFREKKNPALHIEKSPFFVLARNTIMLQRLVIHLSLHYLSSSRLQEVNTNNNFKLLAVKVVAVAYKRFQI